MEKRLLWPDAVKALSIFFVVLIHTTPILQSKTILDFFVGIFYVGVNISIPLFVMTSGALLLGKKESYSIYFSKRLKRVFIPWFLWTIIYVFIEIFLQGKHVGSLSDLKLLFYVTFFSRFWFLPMIFGLYILTPILRILLSKAKSYDIWCFLLLWLIFVVIFPTIRMTFNLNISDATNSSVVQFSGVYILGYIMSRRLNDSKKNNYLWLTLFVVGIVAAYFEKLFLPNYSARLQSFPYNFISPEYLISAIGLFMGVSGFIGKRIVGSFFERLISEISSASIGIYLTHELFTQIVFAHVIFAFPLLGTIVVFICSFLLVAFFRRIPFVKLIVG